MLHTRCPKCAHAPLPEDQRHPAACPACGVILAKVGGGAQAPRAEAARTPEPWIRDTAGGADGADWANPWSRRWRVALVVSLAVWSVQLVRLDLRDGGATTSLLHLPLLVFHEAGHVIFRLFGEWMGVAGGTLGQLVMPLIMCGALLRKRDRFGALIAAWFAGVSLLDIAPYAYDALDPVLPLLGGGTGQDSAHDWIYLLDSFGALPRAHALGGAFRFLGALAMLGTLVWASVLLARKRHRPADSALDEHAAG